MLNQLPTGEWTLVADSRLTYVELTLTVIYQTENGFLSYKNKTSRLESFQISFSNGCDGPHIGVNKSVPKQKGVNRQKQNQPVISAQGWVASLHYSFLPPRLLHSTELCCFLNECILLHEAPAWCSD